MKDKTGKELSASEVMQKGAQRVSSIWLDFVLMLLWLVGLIPSHHIRRACYRMVGMRIGTGSSIHMWGRFYQPSNISIGEDTIIGDNTFLDGRAPLTIGNHVAIASAVMIYNAQHDIDNVHFSAIEKPVTIEDYVFIGPRAIILPGVTIGTGAVVAAGAVVTKDVAPYTVVAGVPAAFVRKRNITNPDYRLGRARWFQ
jgi:maltose O-acetyltransferase